MLNRVGELATASAEAARAEMAKSATRLVELTQEVESERAANQDLRTELREWIRASTAATSKQQPEVQEQQPASSQLAAVRNTYQK